MTDADVVDISYVQNQSKEVEDVQKACDEYSKVLDIAIAVRERYYQIMNPVMVKVRERRDIRADAIFEMRKNTGFRQPADNVERDDDKLWGMMLYVFDKEHRAVG